MSDLSYLHHLDVTGLLTEVPADSILSRSVYGDDRVRVTLFGFAAGQELTEHTASQPAILHFVRGEADLELGGDRLQARPGTWVHMPANLPHSVHAKSDVVMLLYLFKGAD